MYCFLFSFDKKFSSSALLRLALLLQFLTKVYVVRLIPVLQKISSSALPRLALYTSIFNLNLYCSFNSYFVKKFFARRCWASHRWTKTIQLAIWTQVLGAIACWNRVKTAALRAAELRKKSRKFLEGDSPPPVTMSWVRHWVYVSLFW